MTTDKKIVKRVGNFLIVISGDEKGKTLCLSKKGQEDIKGELTNYKAIPTDKLSQCSIINLLYKQGQSISDIAERLVSSHMFPNQKSLEKYQEQGLLTVTDKGFSFDDKQKAKLIMLAKTRVHTHLQASKQRGVSLV